MQWQQSTTLYGSALVKWSARLWLEDTRIKLIHPYMTCSWIVSIFVAICWLTLRVSLPAACAMQWSVQPNDLLQWKLHHGNKLTYLPCRCLTIKCLDNVVAASSSASVVLYAVVLCFWHKVMMAIPWIIITPLEWASRSKTVPPKLASAHPFGLFSMLTTLVLAVGKGSALEDWMTMA